MRSWHLVVGSCLRRCYFEELECSKKAYCGVPPSIQAERHPTRQPAIGSRGQAAQAGQQAKGQATVGEAAVITVSTVTAVTAVTAATPGGGAAVTSLEEACSRPLGVGAD